MKIYPFFIALLLFSCATTVNSQESDFRKSLCVSFGYAGFSNYSSAVTTYSGNQNVWGYCILADADIWRLTDHMSAGVHLGIGPSSYTTSPYSGNSVWTPGIHYGADLHCHLLNNNNSRWDIALNGMIGGYWTLHVSPMLEFGASMSVTYYPFDHFGIFAETGWGKFAFTHNVVSYVYRGDTMFKMGLCYRF